MCLLGLIIGYESFIPADRYKVCHFRRRSMLDERVGI